MTRVPYVEGDRVKFIGTEADLINLNIHTAIEREQIMISTMTVHSIDFYEMDCVVMLSNSDRHFMLTDLIAKC